jgi:hypothetical protein
VSDAVWPFNVTTTSAPPLPWAGAVAVIVEALITVTFVAGAPPMVTTGTPEKLAPASVTVVPPTVDPAPGETLVRRRAVGLGEVSDPPQPAIERDAERRTHTIATRRIRLRSVDPAVLATE